MKEVTYEDLFGKGGAWYSIYPNALEFVRDELRAIFGQHKSIPLQRPCTESHKFIMGIQTKFHQWAHEIADTVNQLGIEWERYDKERYNAVFAFIDILVDKPSFLMDLLKAHNEETLEMEYEEKDRENSKNVADGSFETILAHTLHTVMKLNRLYNLNEHYFFSLKDTEDVEKVKENLMMTCDELKVGDVSKKIIADFFAYGFNYFRDIDFDAHLRRKIGNFLRVLGTNPTELNVEVNDDKLDGDICMELIVSFKAAKEKAQEQQEKVDTLAADEKSVEYRLENEEFNKMKSEAKMHIRILKLWHGEVHKKIERQKDVFVNDKQLRQWKHGDEKKFFSNTFSSFCALFFHLRVIAATMEHFGEEIKKSTQKKVCCAVARL